MNHSKPEPPSPIINRIERQKNHPVWRSQYSSFVNAVAALELPSNATAISISCGDGMWDYLAQKSNPAISRLIATDVVECPVVPADVKLLNLNRTWSFLKVSPDKALPIRDGCCGLVFHQDVLEHTPRPFLLLKECHRILKDGGYLLFGTPNIFRPANILKLFSGRLEFPWRLNQGGVSGGYVHIQEFNEYQLKTMIAEAGFEIVAVRHCFFGISFLSINFCDFPKSGVGKNLCQYLFISARKNRNQATRR